MRHPRTPDPRDTEHSDGTLCPWLIHWNERWLVRASSCEDQRFLARGQCPRA